MNMKPRIFLLGLISVLANSAFAATAVINFSGTIDQYTSPPQFADQEARFLAEGYTGQIVVPNLQQWTVFDRSTRTTTYLDATVPFDGSNGAGLLVLSDTIGGFEGLRSLVANPEFDPSMPVCGRRDFSRGNCAPLNSQNTFVQGVDSDGILGEASLEIVDGLPDSFSWSSPRSVLESFDGFFEDNGFEGGFGLGEATLTLSDITFTGEIDGEFVFFEAGSQFATVTAVPVPAAFWLFGSALAGIAATARRKQL